jgi:hypothetical protein
VAANERAPEHVRQLPESSVPSTSPGRVVSSSSSSCRAGVGGHSAIAIDNKDAALFADCPKIDSKGIDLQQHFSGKLSNEGDTVAESTCVAPSGNPTLMKYQEGTERRTVFA